MQDPVIEEIKERVDIVDIIGSYVPLKKSGTNYKANCPFHGEKTPSFMVNRERQLFRCFGCGEAGDVFAFVMKQENIDFPTALQLLAHKAGVTLPERNPQQNKPGNSPDKPTLHTVNATATQFFHKVLLEHPTGKTALDYLLNRGVTKESIIQFQIGYAPKTTEPLQAVLKKHNYTPTTIRLAGSPERFRDRIMFPFRDVLGNVVGYSGRALQPEQMPKYLNTAETALFHKNRFLYGLFEAKKALSTSNKIVLVEGQLDLVLAHQIGTNYTVATSGTALTDDHLRIMRRYSDTLCLALDNDIAGQKATLRSIDLALNHEFEVSVVPLPNNSDPGEVIAKTPDIWKQGIEKPTPAIEWLFSYFFPEARKPSPTEREQIYNTLFPYIYMQQDPVGQSYSLQHLALAMELTEVEGIRQAFTTWQKTATKQDKPTSPPPPNPKTLTQNDPLITKERSLLGLLLLRPKLLENKNFRLHESDFTNPALARLYNSVHTWYNKTTDSKESVALIRHLNAELDLNGRKSLEKLVFDTQTQVGDYTSEQFLHEYTMLVQTIRSRLREERIHSFAQRIAQAEAAGDRSQVLKLMQEMQQKDS